MIVLWIESVNEMAHLCFIFYVGINFLLMAKHHEYMPNKYLANGID